MEGHADHPRFRLAGSRGASNTCDKVSLIDGSPIDTGSAGEQFSSDASL